MSQNKVYQILKDLGGEASSSEIIEEARQRYPESTLHRYVTVRLRALERKDIVDEITDEVDGTGKSLYWEIIEENWEGIPDDIAKKDFPGEK
jgi:Fe2+ or Zn2+ uptake regulation protein